MKNFYLLATIFATNYIANGMQPLALPYMKMPQYSTVLAEQANQALSQITSDQDPRIQQLRRSGQTLNPSLLTTQGSWQLVRNLTLKDDKSVERRIVRTAKGPQLKPLVDMSFKRIPLSGDRKSFLYGDGVYFSRDYDFGATSHAIYSLHEFSNQHLITKYKDGIAFTTVDKRNELIIVKGTSADFQQSLINLIEPANAIATDLDGKTTIAVDDFGYLTVIDTRSITNPTSKRYKFQDPLTDVAISCDGKKVVALTTNGQLTLVELDNSCNISRQASWDPREGRKIKGFALSPDGNHLVANIEKEGVYTVVAASTGKKNICTSKEMPVSMDVADDGTVAIGYENRIEIYGPKLQLQFTAQHQDLFPDKDVKFVKVTLTKEGSVPRCVIYCNSGIKGKIAVLRPNTGDNIDDLTQK